MADIYNHQCAACGLCKHKTTVCVEGQGNPKAKILMIGEAPGAREDKEGIAFVGNSGRWLWHKLGTLRDKVFVTNVVKCRPPSNRAPKAAEMDVCAGLYLSAEMEMVQPELVVTLGLVATSLFFPIGGFHKGDVVISPQLFGREWPVLAAPHPASAMQNRKDEEIFDICLQTMHQFVNNERTV